MNSNKTSTASVLPDITLNEVMTCVNAADYYQAVEIVRAARATAPQNVYLVAAERQAERLFDLNIRGLLRSELRQEIIDLLRTLLERADLQELPRIENPPPDQGSARNENPSSPDRAAALQKLKKQYMQYAREFETKGNIEHAMAELRRIFILDPYDTVARAYEQRLKHIQKVSDQTLAAAESEIREAPARYVDSLPLERTDREASFGPKKRVPNDFKKDPHKGNGRPVRPTPIPGSTQAGQTGLAPLPVLPQNPRMPEVDARPPEASISGDSAKTAEGMLLSQPLPVLQSIEIKREERSAHIIESPSVPPAPAKSGKDTGPTGLPEERANQITGKQRPDEGAKKFNGRLAAIAAASLAVVFAALGFYLTKDHEPAGNGHDQIPAAVRKAVPAGDAMPKAPAPSDQKPVSNWTKKPIEKSPLKNDKDESRPSSSSASTPSQSSVRVAEAPRVLPRSAVTTKKVDVLPEPSDIKNAVAEKPARKTTPAISGEPVREAQLTKLASPKYPSIALLNSLQGQVILRVQLDRDGKPVQTEILKSTNQIFDAAAVEAAMNSSFSPRITSIGPVNSWVTIPFDFRR